MLYMEAAERVKREGMNARGLIVAPYCCPRESAPLKVTALVNLQTEVALLIFGCI